MAKKASAKVAAKAKTPGKTGRPSKLNEEVTNIICQRMAEGESLRQICADKAMPSKSTVLLWAQKDPVFSDRYARAREMLMECWSDEIVDIADDGSSDWIERKDREGDVIDTVVDHEHINRSRLRIDTRKWLMSKLAPKKYGDRMTQELTGKDGGPIETREMSDLDLARGMLWVLEKAQRA